MNKASKDTFIDKNSQLFGFIQWNINKDTIELCPYLAETLAFPTKEPIQTYSAYRELTHPDDITPINLLMDQLKEKKEEYILLEYRKRCRGGAWRWFTVRGRVTKRDKKGQPLIATGICTDITHFKEAEIKSQQIDLLFSEINHIKRCNAKCEKDCHISNDSFKQACAEAFVCTEILKSTEKVTNSSNSMFIFFSKNTFDKQEVKSDTLYDCNRKNIDILSLSTKKQHFIKTLSRNKKSTIQNGSEISFLGIYLDLPLGQRSMIILERSTPFENTILNFLEPLIYIIKNTIGFKKLINHHEELDNITSFFIKQVPTAVAMFDTSMCYKVASDAWCEAHNLSKPYNVIGKCHYELNPQQPPEWREIHLRGLAGETVSSKRERVFGFTEKPMWIEWIVHPWYTPNKLIGGIIIYMNNITDRVNSENTLNSAIDNLTRSNQELDRFAHVCSHDLKEPLRGISSFINLLLKRNSEQFDEESLLYIDHILKSASRMSTLIHDLLSFSEVKQISANRRTHLNLNEVVRETKESLEFKLFETDTQIKIDPLPSISGVKTQFSQLFGNLISNAIKFRSEKPLVIEVSALDKNSFWEIHVRDNGIGIPAEHQNDVFTMFTRLHSKSQYEGSGIGLSTCKKIVNDHDGEIYVQSVPEGGSDFVFTLPKTDDKTLL